MVFLCLLKQNALDIIQTDLIIISMFFRIFVMDFRNLKHYCWLISIVVYLSYYWRMTLPMSRHPFCFVFSDFSSKHFVREISGIQLALPPTFRCGLSPSAINQASLQDAATQQIGPMAILRFGIFSFTGSS